MNRRNRIFFAETSADLVLGGKLTAEAFAVHFEDQMHPGQADRLLRLLYVSLAQFTRNGATMLGDEPMGFL
jgi:hypothetical protein